MGSTTFTNDKKTKNIMVGLSKEHESLLSDPTLTENTDDITYDYNQPGNGSHHHLQEYKHPHHLNEQFKDNESVSGNSVVITKNSDSNENSSDIKGYIQKKMVVRSFAGDEESMESDPVVSEPVGLGIGKSSQNELEEEKEDNEDEEDVEEEEEDETAKSYQGYYSDSDFEEELEKRLLHYKKETHMDYLEEHRLEDRDEVEREEEEEEEDEEGSLINYREQEVEQGDSGDVLNETTLHDTTDSDVSGDDSSLYDDDHVITLPRDDEMEEHTFVRESYTDEVGILVDNADASSSSNSSSSTSSGEGEDNESDEEVDIDDEDDEYIPPPLPPKELDPDKLYALYPFHGPDPSHCNLDQDESCYLLNDQDGYWWLVKRCSDGRIGFAPAEILETFPERLARLNCWKNEQILDLSTSESETTDSNGKQDKNTGRNTSSDNNNNGNGNVSKVSINLRDKDISYSVDSIEEDTDEQDGKPTRSTDSVGNASSVVKKSVSFSNAITYLEKITATSGTISGDEIQGDEDGEMVDELVARTEELDFNDDDDDRSEVVSDVSWNHMPNLNVSKMRKNNTDSPPALALHKNSRQEEVVGHSAIKNDDDNTENEEDYADEKEDMYGSSDYDVQTPTSAHEDREHSRSLPFKDESTPRSHQFSNLNYGNNDLSEYEEDHLTQVFVAPPSVFTSSKKTTPSSPSIGEYSPSSSEFTNDSPPTDHLQAFGSAHENELQQSFHENETDMSVQETTLPSSKAIPDISKIHSNSSTSFQEEKELHPVINDLYTPVFNKFDELLAKIQSSKSSLSLNQENN